MAPRATLHLRAEETLPVAGAQLSEPAGRRTGCTAGDRLAAGVGRRSREGLAS